MTIHYDDKGKFFTDVVTKIPVPAVIQTLTHRIHGTVHIRQDERLMDALNRPAEFLAVTDAAVMSVRGEIIYRTDFISIFRTHIVWLIPDDELVSSEDQPVGEKE